MPEQIAKANIDHFKKLLEIEKDSKKRGAIKQLLAEEKQKLASLLKRRGEKKEG